MNTPTTLVLNGVPTAVEVGERVYDIIEAHQVPIASACGGRGICHLCRVQTTVDPSHLNPPTALEKATLGNVSLALGWRLACQTQILGEASVTVPAPRRKQKPGTKP